MGAMALLLLPFFVTSPKSSLNIILLTLVGVVGAYYIGMLSLFALLERVQSSTVTSLLGLKLLVISCWSSMSGDQLHGYQWLAVVIMLAASLILKDSEEGIKIKHVAWALGTCSCFATSDLFIVQLIAAIEPTGGFKASMFALVLSYLLAGLTSACAWRFWKGSTRQDWYDATGFAFCWFGHMLCLYCAIPLIGLVHSVILQSSRSVFAVLIGIIASTHLNQTNETKIRNAMRKRQWISAFAVVTATFIFQCVVTE